MHPFPCSVLEDEQEWHAAALQGGSQGLGGRGPTLKPGTTPPVPLPPLVLRALTFAHLMQRVDAGEGSQVAAAEGGSQAAEGGGSSGESNGGSGSSGGIESEGALQGEGSSIGEGGGSNAALQGIEGGQWHQQVCGLPEWVSLRYTVDEGLCGNPYRHPTIIQAYATKCFLVNLCNSSGTASWGFRFHCFVLQL